MLQTTRKRKATPPSPANPQCTKLSRPLQTLRASTLSRFSPANRASRISANFLDDQTSGQSKRARIHYSRNGPNPDPVAARRASRHLDKIDQADRLSSPNSPHHGGGSARTWSFPSTRASSFAADSLPLDYHSPSQGPTRQISAADQLADSPHSPTYLGPRTLHYQPFLTQNTPPDQVSGSQGLRPSAIPTPSTDDRDVEDEDDASYRQRACQQLRAIPRLSQPIMHNWDAAYSFLLSETCDFSALRLHQIRTFDYVPHDSQQGVRTCYRTILHLMDSIHEDVDIIDDDLREPLQTSLRQLLLALPAWILQYEPNLGKFSKQEAIKQRCHSFMTGNWKTLYALAHKACNRQRPIRLNDDLDRIQERKNKRALILSKKHNLSKSLRTLTQDGLAPHDATDTLRAQHQRDITPMLDLHLHLARHIQDTTDWDKLTPSSKYYDQIRKSKNGKASDRHGMRPEIHKFLMEDTAIFDLYSKHILGPIVRGTLYHDDYHSSIGAQMFAARKTDPTKIRPVINPDADRCTAAAVLCNAVFRSPPVLHFFESSNPRFSQRAISKDGCLWKAKEVQRYVEQHNLLLQQRTVDRDDPAIIELDIKDAFPSIHKQAVFDSLAGIASKDYLHSKIKKGESLNMPDALKTVLPLAILLYSQTIQMEYYPGDKPVQCIDVDDGLSQGSPEATPLAITVIHLAVESALKQHPSDLIRVLAIADDLTILGPLHVTTPFVMDLRLILKELLQAEVNIAKSSLILLQLHHEPNPLCWIRALLDQLPALAELPLKTAGAIFVGFPIGHSQFITDFLQTAVGRTDADTKKLLQFPYAQVFLQLIKHCIAPRIDHLLRGVSPHDTMSAAESFDNNLEQNIAAYFDLDLRTNVQVADINPNSPLGGPEYIALAKHQLREQEGLNLHSAAQTAVPAFYAATLRHLVKIASNRSDNTSLLLHNESSGLLSRPFQQAAQQLEARGAISLTIDNKKAEPCDGIAQPGKDADDSFYLPHIDSIDKMDSLAVSKTLCHTITHSMDQSKLTKWYKRHHKDVARVTAIRANNPSIKARAQHLAQAITDGPHGRFDIPPAVNISITPTAWMTSTLPFGSDGMSAYQMSLYLTLILGLPMPPMLTTTGTCPCGAARSLFGYHQLNCKKWAGRSWHKGHNHVVKALTYETRRLGLGAVDSDRKMKTDYSHPDSQKRGDLAVTAEGQIQVTNFFDHMPRSDIVADVKICAMVTGSGDWKAKMTADGKKFLNPTLTQAEAGKYKKHEEGYAAVGMSFVAFVVGSFGNFGSDAARFLYALAFLELRQNDAMRAKATLPPLSPTDRAQFRARCFRQSTTRISAALAKATVMRLTGAPSLPDPSYLPRADLARNRPGPADANLPPLRRRPRPAALQILSPSPLPSCLLRA